MSRRNGLFLGLALAAFSLEPATAQTSEKREFDDAVAQAYAHGTVGPATVALGDVATLNLPKGFVFVPASVSHRLMHGLGNTSDGSSLGVVIPGIYSGWFIALSDRKTGHVEGATLAKVDPEEIRGTIAAATRRGNAARLELGSGPIDAGAFVEPPRFDAVRQSFTTAVRIYESGPSTGGEDSVNIDTALFGRTHTLQASLIDGMADFAKHRAMFEQVVAAMSFVPGQQAQDFVVGRDAVAPRPVEQVFAGQTMAELAAEAAEDAAEAKRIAELPPPQTLTREMKMALLGGMAALALLFAFIGLRTRRDPNAVAPRAGGIDRLDRVKSIS